MQCPQCRHENSQTAKFCEECGQRLSMACPACGFAAAPSAKFCPECGQQLTRPTSPPEVPGYSASPQTYTPQYLVEKILTSRSTLEGERKQVTVLFADLKASMELLADRDSEEARQLLDPVLERMMEAVHRYEGTVNQIMGDGIMALFGAPIAHEDHAVRACYAALAMQAAIRRYTEEVRRSHGIEVQSRVGLNSGEVVVRAIANDLHMDYSAIGQTTHLAARMEQLALPGSIRLTAETLRMAEGLVQVISLGPVPVKGLLEPVDVFELVGAVPTQRRLQAYAARGLTRFVGRQAELETLRQALALAGDGHGQVVAVIGESGVGKTRLFYEFTHSQRTQGWLTLESYSVSYGKATSYLPVRDLLKVYFELDDRDEARRVREKLTGKLLTLDPALGPTLPALLALQVEVSYRLGQAYWYLGDYRQAIACFERNVVCLEGDLIRERFGMPGLPSVLSRDWLVRSLAEQGAFVEGRERGEDVVRLAEALAATIDNPFSLSCAYYGVGHLYLRHGDLDKAIPALERSLEVSQVGHIRLLIFSRTSHVGYAYALAGRVAEALPLLEQAVEQAASMRFTAGQSFLIAHLSEAYLLAGRLEEALTQALRALDLSCEQKERGHQAWVLRLLGEIHSHRASLDAQQAEEYYRQALSLAEELGMRPLQAHCHLGLGTLYAEIRQREQARTELSVAIELYRAMEMTFWLPQAEAALAQVGGGDGL